MKMNKCIACGLNFGSVFAFDTHRVFRIKNDWSTRRCLITRELRGLGMEPDDYGRWRIPMPEDVKNIHARVLPPEIQPIFRRG